MAIAIGCALIGAGILAGAWTAVATGPCAIRDMIDSYRRRRLGYVEASPAREFRCHRRRRLSRCLAQSLRLWERLPPDPSRTLDWSR